MNQRPRQSRQFAGSAMIVIVTAALSSCSEESVSNNVASMRGSGTNDGVADRSGLRISQIVPIISSAQAQEKPRRPSRSSAGNDNGVRLPHADSKVIAGDGWKWNANTHSAKAVSTSSNLQLSLADTGLAVGEQATVSFSLRRKAGTLYVGLGGIDGNLVSGPITESGRHKLLLTRGDGKDLIFFGGAVTAEVSEISVKPRRASRSSADSDNKIQLPHADSKVIAGDGWKWNAKTRSAKGVSTSSNLQLSLANTGVAIGEQARVSFKLRRTAGKLYVGLGGINGNPVSGPITESGRHNLILTRGDGDDLVFFGGAVTAEVSDISLSAVTNGPGDGK